jgi:hypothetical protein
MQKLRLKIAVGVTALVAAVGGGAALAADRLSPQEESAVVVADAAKELGVTEAKLEAALKQALKNRVDAALAAGTITQAQANEMKQRIDCDVPLVGMGHGSRGGHHGHGFVELSAAASYIGVTEAALRTSLESGDTLAEVAVAKGKTRAGLVAALVAAGTERVNEKAEEHGLTAAQKAELLADLQERVEAAVDGEMPPRGGPGRHGGPPPAGDSGSDDA